MVKTNSIARAGGVWVTALCLLSFACGTGGVAPDEARLSSLTITPATASVAAGKTQQFTVAYNLSTSIAAAMPPDGASVATWDSSDPTLATIDANGLATTLKAGTVTITATSGTFTATATLTITAPLLMSIAVTPATPMVSVGLTTQLTATGTYTDHSTSDITSQVTWSSSDTGVATVSNAAATGGAGVVTGVVAGQSTITATDGTLSATTMVTVTGAVLQSVTVTPVTAGATSVVSGLTLQLQATGSYSDGTMLPLTMATWTSANPAIATVGNTAGQLGLVTGTAAGMVAISASVTPAGSTTPISGSFTVTVLPPTLVSIGVAPPAPLIAAGTTQAFTATGIYSDMSTQDLTPLVMWAAATPSIANFGLVTGMPNVATGLLMGSTGVTATYNGVVGTANLAVSQATLSSIEISPDNTTLAVGTIQQLSALGTYSDGTIQDITSLVTWSSSLPSFATVTSSTGSHGLVTAVATGTTQITATLGTVTATVPVVVSSATLSSITIGPPAPEVAAGATLQLTATGVYSDGSTQDLTSQVSWASEQANFATVSSAAMTAGLLTAVKAGQATVTATFTRTGESIIGTTTITVTSATLMSLSIDPPQTTLSQGLTQALTATGVYSDNSSVDLTTAVTWTSSKPTFATVSNGGGTQGVVTGLAHGAATITAALSGVSATASVRVTTAAVTSITVSGSSASVNVGEKDPFTATASYSDGSTLDVTSQVVWTSSDLTVATVSNAAGNRGVATGIAMGGPVTITATLGTGATAISGTAPLSVFAATITSIEVNAPSLPTPPSMAVPLTAQLYAVAHYSNGGRLNVTAVASWTSGSPAVATVSNTTGSTGVLTAVAMGTATLTATYRGKSGTLAVTVTNATVKSIAVAPATDTIAVGTYSGLTATATFSDGSTADVTAQATWTSKNPAFVTVSNDALYKASLYGVAATPANSPVEIDATLEGKKGSALIAVSTATLTSITVVSVDAPQQAIKLEVGHALELQAVGTFSDGSKQPLRRQVIWTSSDTSLVAVSNAPGTWGYIEGVAVTTSGMLPTVTATWGTISGEATVTVMQ